MPSHATFRRALLLAATLIAVGAHVAAAQGADAVRFGLGVGGEQVAEAWNPLRLELRDVPPATLTLSIDQGTLRSGEVPLTIERSVRGGAGIAIFRDLVYLPSFASLSWRLATSEWVIASGSIAGREADPRPLDLLLTRNPGAYRGAYLDAFGPDVRLVDISAAELPTDAAAYDGVRSVMIDGTAAAPRLEAVAAAVAGGTVVALRGPLPPSHVELELLLGGADAVRLGAGALFISRSDVTELVNRLAALGVPPRETLLAALLDEPLVNPPTPVPETLVALAAALFALATLLLVRWAGAPGLIAALALAALLSLATWRLLRPSTPQITGEIGMALAGDRLALELAGREVLTLPRASLSFPERARPLRPQEYRVDDDGTHFGVDRWRAVLLELVPVLTDAALVMVDGQPRNVGATPLYDLHLVGEGTLGDLAPGAGVEPTGTEEEVWPGYARLMPLLPTGSLLARTDCADACLVWLLYPELAAATPGERSTGSSTSGTWGQTGLYSEVVRATDPFAGASNGDVP